MLYTPSMSGVFVDPTPDFIESITTYLPMESLVLVQKALKLATAVHANQFRKDGTPYLYHPIEVAHILARWHAPADILATALLHDVFKRNYAVPPSTAALQETVGPAITKLVEETSRLGEWGQLYNLAEGETAVSSTPEHTPWVAAALKRSPMAVVIKIADRLHNFRSLYVLSPEQQTAFAERVLKIFVPFAERLGIRRAKRDLEDYAFQVLQPDKYQRTANRYAQSHHETETLVPSIQNHLEQAGLAATIQVRPRSNHDRYEAENLQGKALSPHVAAPLLVIASDPTACYQVLGHVHNLWQPLANEFNDYIAMPKVNGYRALHTRVRHPNGNTILVMICDPAMQLVSEYGLTAQWWGVSAELLPTLPKWEDPPPNKIAVLTPGGDVLILPIGATPIDFAYGVHGTLGHQCIGALVNGRMSPLDHPLENGDMVRILTSSATVGPAPEWLNSVKTSKARHTIRQWIQSQNPEKAANAGWTLLDSTLRQDGITLSTNQVMERLKTIAPEMGYSSLQHLLIAIGLKQRTPDSVAAFIKKPTRQGEDEATLQATIVSLEQSNLPRRLANCCHPAPPDPIVAYVTRQNRVMVHRADCPHVQNLQPVVQADWNTEYIPQRSQIHVVALDRGGLVRDVSDIVSDAGINMISFHADRMVDGSAVLQIGLSDVPYSLLENMLHRLERVRSVRRAELRAPTPTDHLWQFARQSATSGHLPPAYTLRPVSQEGFYGRLREMQELLNNLRHVRPGEAVLLWGPRRIGKTSLLLRFKELVMGGADYIPIFLDMQGVSGRSTTIFLLEILREIVQTVQDSRVATPSLSRMKRDPLGYFSRFLENAPVLRNRHLVLILDEFQVLGGLREDGVTLVDINRYFRSLIQHRTGLSIIFSGGGILETLLNQPATSFMLEVARHQKLDCLDENAARQLIVEPATHIIYEETAVSHLLLLTARHPYYLQWFCRELIAQAEREQRARILPQDIDRLLTTWLPDQGEQFFSHLWGNTMGFTPQAEKENKLVLTTIAHLANDDGFIRFEDLVHSKLASQFNETALWQIVRNLEKMDTLIQTQKQLRIKVALCRYWLRQNYTIEQLL